jgi:hypothetical protein
MKKILIITILAIATSACSKSEFKETKVAPASTNIVATQASTAPELANKELPPGHPPVDGKGTTPAGMPTPKVDPSAANVGNIAKAKGGIKIVDCFDKKAALKNKPVILRGKVVKFNSGIMGKNWIHLRDGSGAEGKNDIVITTDGNAKVGDTITVTGNLSTDKDIGSGYFFPVIIENANIKAE